MPNPEITTTKCRLTNGQEIKLPVKMWMPNQLSKKQLSEFHFENVGEKTLYIRIPQMTSGISLKQKALLDFIDGLDDDINAIIDIRQNGGGDNTFIYELAKRFYIISEEFPQMSITAKGGLFGYGGNVNAFYFQWKMGELQNSPFAERAKAGYLETLKDFEDLRGKGFHLDKVEIAEAKSSAGSGIRNNKSNSSIIILADKMCGSSCETTIEILRDRATVIGTHSGGALNFGNVGLIVLPNSKVGFSGGWKQFQDAWNTEEGVGYAPHYYYIGKDSLEIAKKYLSSILAK